MTKKIAGKAVQELSNKLVIKGLSLNLIWDRAQAPRLESVVSDELLKNHVLQPPGIQDQHPALLYFKILSLAPQQGRAYYPSQDSQRTGACIPSYEGTFSGSNESIRGSQKQQAGTVLVIGLQSLVAEEQDLTVAI
ncbi:zinc finger CCCH domain-containing protein 40-like [Apium graveolens]|uniref:zinc finger CCCH domain-containing protein 40-like n=1 Tax=Apium graveolens TaxID=4045 RepID=UPI003D78FD37